MDFFVLAVLIISVAATLIAATVVLATRPRTHAHIWLALFLYSCGLWSLSSGLPWVGYGEHANLWLVRGAFVMATATSFAMYLFARSIARQKSSIIARFAGFASLAVVILSVTPLVISKVNFVQNHVIPVRQPLYLLVILVIVAQLAASIVVLLRYYHTLKPSRTRIQILLILIGLISGTAAGVTTNVILPNIAPALQAARFASLGSVVWTLTLVYAVVRKGFLDVRLAVVRSVGYLFSIVTVSVLYFVLAGTFSSLLGISAKQSRADIATNVFLIITISLLFGPIQHFFNYVTRRIFYQHGYDLGELYGRLTNELAQVDSIGRLNRIVIRELGEAFQPETISTYIYNVRGELKAASLTDKPMMGDKELRELTDGMKASRLLYLEADPYAAIRSQIDKLANKFGYVLIFPLNSADVPLGYLCLGLQKSRSYTPRDRQILTTISDELSITIEKVLSIDKVRDFNRQLKREIDNATRELRASNTKLLEMDATKDEFISMASHQLRTPLTSVKGYISMVLEGDVGEVPRQQRKLLSEAYVSSERMVHLIGDFLNVSRLQTGKFIIDRHQADLARITHQEVESMRQMAATHDLTINYNRPERFPVLFLDEGKLRQVIMNFIDNAIYYSPESSHIDVKLSIEDGNAVLKVIDKGMGVPEKAKAHLFTKFFRAENARKQRPDGTGVGLFLAKKVIDGHGGKIVFESTIGKGSVFGFRLPIKQLSEPPKTTPV